MAGILLRPYRAYGRHRRNNGFAPLLSPLQAPFEPGDFLPQPLEDPAVLDAGRGDANAQLSGHFRGGLALVGEEAIRLPRAGVDARPHALLRQLEQLQVELLFEAPGQLPGGFRLA
jgi:hypothetical protein